MNTTIEKRLFYINYMLIYLYIYISIYLYIHAEVISSFNLFNTLNII